LTVTGKEIVPRFQSFKTRMCNHVIECAHTSLAEKNRARDIKSLDSRAREAVIQNILWDDLARDAVELLPAPAAPAAGAAAENDQHPVARPAVGQACATCGTVRRPATNRQGRLLWQPIKDTVLTLQEEDDFRMQLARGTISAGLPEQWIEDPEIKKAFLLIRPLITTSLPSRRQIGGIYLDRLTETANKNIKDAIHDQMITLSADGWKNIRKDNIVGFVVNLRGAVYSLGIQDVTHLPKTGHTILRLLIQKIDELRGPTWGANVVALCTDDGSDCRWARKQLAETHPTLITTVCWAHQSNLILRDVIKGCPALQAIITEAATIIHWFNSHSIPRKMLLESQRTLQGRPNTPGILPVGLLKSVVTRWTSTYSANARLERLKPHLESLSVGQLRANVLAGISQERNAQTQAGRVLDILRRDEFWQILKESNVHLRKLAVASMILQQDTLRIDHVVFMIGYLWKHFDALPVDDGLASQIADAAQRSLKRRWEALDKPVFIIATILSPFERLQHPEHPSFPFNPTSEYTSPLSLSALLRRVFERIVGRNSNTLVPAFMNYLNRVYPFDGNFWALVYDLKIQAESEGRVPDAASLWKTIRTEATADLSNVAQILHSVCPSAAGNERNFSLFGNIHTKNRAKLSAEKVANIAKVRQDLRRAAEPNPRPKRRRMDEGGAPPRHPPGPPPRPPPNQVAAAAEPALPASPDDPPSGPPPAGPSHYTGSLPDELLTAEEFEREALQWMVDLTNTNEHEPECANSLAEIPDSQDWAAQVDWAGSFSITLEDAFDWKSGLAFDHSAILATSMLYTEESLLEELMREERDPQGARATQETFEEDQSIARATTGREQFNTVGQSLAAALP
jgi:hypothetical protein